jgi:hypothetical protein
MSASITLKARLGRKEGRVLYSKVAMVMIMI